MFVVSEESIDDVMRAVMEEVQTTGISITPTKGPAKEIVGACLELKNPRARLSRSGTRSIAFSALGELLWYLSGSDDVASISYYIKMYDSLGVDGRVEGAYGPRLRGESGRLEDVVHILRSKTDSRQAVVQVFEHSDLGNELDVPCTCVLQFLLRDGSLDLVVYMRSNDVFRGLPHDVFCFTMIQELVARQVGAEVGRYIHNVGSLHLYEDDLARAQEFLDEGWQGTSEMPAMPSGDQTMGLELLLDTEADLRTGVVDQPSNEMLAKPYWGDLATLLWAYRLSKTGSADLDSVKQHLASEFFKIYLTERQLKVEGRR